MNIPSSPLNPASPRSPALPGSPNLPSSPIRFSRTGSPVSPSTRVSAAEFLNQVLEPGLSAEKITLGKRVREESSEEKKTNEEPKSKNHKSDSNASHTSKEVMQRLVSMLFNPETARTPSRFDSVTAETGEKETDVEILSQGSFAVPQKPQPVSRAQKATLAKPAVKGVSVHFFDLTTKKPITAQANGILQLQEGSLIGISMANLPLNQSITIGYNVCKPIGQVTLAKQKDLVLEKVSMFATFVVPEFVPNQKVNYVLVNLFVKKPFIQALPILLDIIPKAGRVIESANETEVQQTNSASNAAVSSSAISELSNQTNRAALQQVQIGLIFGDRTAKKYLKKGTPLQPDHTIDIYARNSSQEKIKALFAIMKTGTKDAIAQSISFFEPNQSKLVLSFVPTKEDRLYHFNILVGYASQPKVLPKSLQVAFPVEQSDSTSQN